MTKTSSVTRNPKIQPLDAEELSRTTTQPSGCRVATFTLKTLQKILGVAHEAIAHMASRGATFRADDDVETPLVECPVTPDGR